MNTLADYFPKTLQFKSGFTILDDEKILMYSRRFIHRLLEDYNGDFMWNEYDCLSTCYCVGVCDFKEAQKLIRTFLFTELRLSYSTKNDMERFNPTKFEEQKVCTKCKTVKPVACFRELTDVRVGFTYVEGQCEDCYNDYIVSDKRKETKRLLRLKPEYKEKARLRYLKYKNKHKYES